MAWMESERAALVTTARDADPDGPTLCEGWTTRRLVAHLVLRERRPLRSAADVMSRRAPGNERFLNRLVATARSPDGYQALLDRFAQGPPAWSPVTWAGDRAHLLEYVVHHEDMRRASTDPAPPRGLPDVELEAIWKQLLSASRLLLRGSPVGVALRTQNRSQQLVRRGPEPVTLIGEPVELALHIFGRTRVAEVEVTGPASARERYDAWAA